LSELPGIGAEDARPLIVFLRDRPLKKKDSGTDDSRRSRRWGKIGGKDAAGFFCRVSNHKVVETTPAQQERRTGRAACDPGNYREQADGGRARR